MDFEGFSKFWLDLGRICMDPLILKGFCRILVRSGTDFHGSVDFRGFSKFWLDLGRISMDPWILEDLGWTPGKDFHGSTDFGGF